METPAHHHRSLERHTPAPRRRRVATRSVVWFALCLIAVLAFTSFSIYYNVVHTQGDPTADIFRTIRRRFQDSSSPLAR